MAEIDSMTAARLHRDLRTKALKKQPYHAHLPHNVMPSETLDPSLSNRFAYGNRADWYAAAAMCGWFDADAGIEQGPYLLLPPHELAGIAQGKKKTGMSLYE